LRRSSAWISWALQKPGRLSSATARACACRVPRARVRVRTGSSGCGIVTVARYNVQPVAPNARRVTAKPAPVAGPPLTAHGKPEVLSRHANPLDKNSYTVLQRLTPAQQAICHLTGDQPGTACTPAVRSLLPAR
jgi:hypothetical protein